MEMFLSLNNSAQTYSHHFAYPASWDCIHARVIICHNCCKSTPIPIYKNKKYNTQFI